MAEETTQVTLDLALIDVIDEALEEYMAEGDGKSGWYATAKRAYDLINAAREDVI